MELLPNHYGFKMQVNGEIYNCMELYLASAVTGLFHDQQNLGQIHLIRYPVEQKRLRYKVQKYMQEGLRFLSYVNDNLSRSLKEKLDWEGILTHI